MDDPRVDQADFEASVRFIPKVNRCLGGVAAALNQLRRWSADWPVGRTIRILDVGTGSADIPLAIANWASTSQHQVHITAIDPHAATLAIARERVGKRIDIELIQVDARNLMEAFEPDSFDYAHAGTFLSRLRNYLKTLNRLYQSNTHPDLRSRACSALARLRFW